MLAEWRSSTSEVHRPGTQVSRRGVARPLGCLQRITSSINKDQSHHKFSTRATLTRGIQSNYDRYRILLLTYWCPKKTIMKVDVTKRWFLECVIIGRDVRKTSHWRINAPWMCIQKLKDKAVLKSFCSFKASTETIDSMLSDRCWYIWWRLFRIMDLTWCSWWRYVGARP